PEVEAARVGVVKVEAAQAAAWLEAAEAEAVSGEGAALPRPLRRGPVQLKSTAYPLLTTMLQHVHA
ncbi:MAG: hypothetical protein QXO66_00770, partial [Thermofilum sp.]